MEAGQTEDLVKISIMSDKEKEMKIHLRGLQQELANEQERCNRYLMQVYLFHTLCGVCSSMDRGCAY